MKNKICCVTGHRPFHFPWNYNNSYCGAHQEYAESMACHIYQLITKKGFDYFICGGAIGVDSDFAETVIDMRNQEFDHIKLEIAVPCQNQDLKWSNRDKSKYQKLLQAADIVTLVTEKYSRYCMQKRNKYMVDKSDCVFAYWNQNIHNGGTVKTIQYANSKNKHIELFILNNFL